MSSLNYFHYRVMEEPGRPRQPWKLEFPGSNPGYPTTHVVCYTAVEIAWGFCKLKM
jgi:hypothetical protein